MKLHSLKWLFCALIFLFAETSAYATSFGGEAYIRRAVYARAYINVKPEQYPQTTVAKKLLLRLRHRDGSRAFSLYEDGTVLCRDIPQYVYLYGVNHEYRRAQLSSSEVSALISLVRGAKSQTYAARDRTLSCVQLEYLDTDNPVRIDFGGQKGWHETSPIQIEILAKGLVFLGRDITDRWLPNQALLECTISRFPPQAQNASFPWPSKWPLVDTLDEDGRRIESFTLIVPAEAIETGHVKTDSMWVDKFEYLPLSMGGVTYNVKGRLLLPEEERACLSIVKVPKLATYQRSLPTDWERYIYFLRCPFCGSPENHPQFSDKPIQLQSVFEPPREVHQGLVFTFKRNLTNFEKVNWRSSKSK